MMASKVNIAIITGASRGIGLTTAQVFLSKGWEVITCSRGKLPSDISSNKKLKLHCQVDLADSRNVDLFIDEVKNCLGGQPLNALVNNAGVSPKTFYKERLGCLNGDINAWREVFELNFYAPLRLSRGFASSLTSGSGAIVNITSIAGHKIHPFAGSAYSISKTALSGLTREMANEFAELGVRVNSVAPGEIETAMLSPETEVLIPRIPLNRLGQPNDIASTIYFLCSEDSTYITGTEIFVTGLPIPTLTLE